MANFDYSLGHVRVVGSLSHEELVLLNDQPALWRERAPVLDSRRTEALLNSVVIDERKSNSGLQDMVGLLASLGVGGLLLNKAEHVFEHSGHHEGAVNEDGSEHNSANSLDTSHLSPAIAGTLNMVNNVMADAHKVASGKLSQEEMHAMDKRYASMTAHLDANNAADNIRHSVAESRQHLQDSNTAHQYRQWENESKIEDSHLASAGHEMTHGGSSTYDLEAAEHEHERATHYHEVAEQYDPDHHHN